MRHATPFRRIALALAVLAIAACDHADDAIIAQEVRGEWVATSGAGDRRTDDGRAFVVTRDSLYLHQAGGIVVAYPIQQISRVERRDHIAYAIRYAGIVEDHELRLEYRPDPGRFITIRNQPRVIWRPASAVGNAAGSNGSS